MALDLPPVIPAMDFWSRQAHAQTRIFECAPYGIPALITSNQQSVLEAARLSTGRYSRGPASASATPIRIQCIVTAHGPAEPAPADLDRRLVYSGVEDWITVSAGEWGYGFAHLPSRQACVVLSPGLASDVRFVSRYFIDHYVLNFVLTEWGMLHASCVLDIHRRRLIALLATHNTGKSTAALRLTQAGYAFLADGMALLHAQGERFIVGGYPTGEVKLRDDVLAWFPEYGSEGIRAREQLKTIVNLRAAHPERMAEELVEPEAIEVYFVERHARPETVLAPISVAAALDLIADHTVYWDDAGRLGHNTTLLHRLVRTARLRRLRLGDDPERLVAAIGQAAG